MLDQLLRHRQKQSRKDSSIVQLEITAGDTLRLTQGSILAQTVTNQGGDIRVSAGRAKDCMWT